MTWLLPSRKRTGNLKRFFRACRETGLSTPGLVLVNADELAATPELYRPSALDLPSGWEIRGVVADSMHEAIRQVFDQVKDGKWVGLLQDDLMPMTANWDMKLIESLNGWNVVSADDGRCTGRMQGAIVWSGALIRQLGWIYPPGFRHLYGDDVWETLGKETLCWLRRGDVITNHVNETYVVSPDDTARHVASHTDHDRERFKEWSGAEKHLAINAIECLRTDMGFKMVTANMDGVNLAIATPCGSGRYDAHYQDCLEATKAYFREQNIPCGALHARGHADVSLARSSLFSAFLRTRATHCLWIDDDMGWDVTAVAKLFAAEKDFVAAAGPKKSYPIKYAANMSTEDGQILPLRIDNTTGLVKVTEVGLAFALMTRSCAERMTKGYPALGFNGPNGERDYAPFIPMVRHNRYLSEDFAFCQRWRMIGGEIFLAPDIRLSHTGSHTFEGALIDAIRPPNAAGRAR